MNRTNLLCAVAAAALSLGIVGPALAQMGPMTDPYGEGDVTRAEAEAAAARRFDAMDADKDGVLAPGEMAAMRPPRPADAPAAGGPEGGPPPRGGHQGGPGGMMMRMMDANGDGKITRDEFVAGQLRRFDQMDENHDGMATREERANFFEDLRARMMMRGGN